MSKRYLKYLTKKYLKKYSVRDWLRVIASNKDRKYAPCGSSQQTCWLICAASIDLLAAAPIAELAPRFPLANAACMSSDTSTLPTTMQRMMSKGLSLSDHVKSTAFLASLHNDRGLQQIGLHPFTHTTCNAAAPKGP